MERTYGDTSHPGVTLRAATLSSPNREPHVSIISSVTSITGRVAGDVKGSVRRARLEGERRVLERRHRAALEALGARAYALVDDGTLSADALAPEVAEVRSRLMEIDASLAATGDVNDGEVQERSADIAFPMVSDDPGAHAEEV
jgi:hypothetical protein